MLFLPDTVYHIYNHANGRDNLFAESENYRYFLELYGKHIGPIAETYAFCLMPNHFHFLLRTRGFEDLPGLKNLEGLGAEGAKIKERFFSQQFSTSSTPTARHSTKNITAEARFFKRMSEENPSPPNHIF